MRNAQDGDRQSYELLLKEVAVVLRTFIAKRVPSSEWVEDIIQDVLIAIHQDRHTYDPGRPFSPWMYAIARHRFLDFIRKHRLLEKRELLGVAGMEDVGQVDLLASDRASEQLHGALADLSG